MTAASREAQAEAERLVLAALRNVEPGKWISAHQIGQITGLPRQPVMYALRRLRFAGVGLEERQGEWINDHRRIKVHQIFRVRGGMIPSHEWPTWLMPRAIVVGQSVVTIGYGMGSGSVEEKVG
jgi:hypothetical protein